MEKHHTEETKGLWTMVHLKKKKHLSKLGNFCVAILTLKMEEKKQHSQHFILYYFKKGKKATGTQKKHVCTV